jgi:hypothetical protein
MGRTSLLDWPATRVNNKKNQQEDTAAWKCHALEPLTPDCLATPVWSKQVVALVSYPSTYSFALDNKYVSTSSDLR